MKFSFYRLSLALVILASGAVAGAPNDYHLVWRIAEPSAQKGANWYREQSELSFANLRPDGLSAASGEIRTPDGKLVAPAGLQFYLMSAPRPLVCSLEKGAEGSVSASRRVCLVDGNDDGQVDAFFTRGHDREWFMLNGRLPARLDPIAPIRLTDLAPDRATRKPYLSFHYQRYLDGGLTLPIQADGKDAIRFHFKISERPRKGTMWLVKNCMVPTLPSYCARGPAPTSFAFAGLNLKILERRKEDLLIDVTSNFDAARIYVDNEDPRFYQAELFLADAPR